MSREEFGPTMDAGNVTGHLRRLAAAGVSTAAVAALLDVPGITSGILQAIRRGEVERVDYATGAAVLAVMVPHDDRDTSWTADAECRRPYVAGVARSFGLARGTDLFFATPGSGRHECPERRAAVAICGTCSVKEECLAYALAAPGFFPEVGIWGGTTDNERNKLRKGRK